jgi:hypothetical protein
MSKDFLLGLWERYFGKRQVEYLSTFQRERERICNYKFYKVNVLRKRRSESYSQEETCLKFSQAKRNARLSYQYSSIYFDFLVFFPKHLLVVRGKSIMLALGVVTFFFLFTIFCLSCLTYPQFPLGTFVTFCQLTLFNATCIYETVSQFLSIRMLSSSISLPPAFLFVGSHRTKTIP